MNYSKTMIEEKIISEILTIIGDANYECDCEKDEINKMINSLDFINLIIILENFYNISFKKINFEKLTVSILSSIIIDELQNAQKKHTEIDRTINKIFEGDI